MTFDDYQRAAMRTLKSARDAQTMLTNGALGLAGEAGLARHSGCPGQCRADEGGEHH